MGNAVSKVVDVGLRIACVATRGQFGKSDQGYHIGPLRLKDDSSIGLKFNVGICKVNMRIGKNEYGSFSLEGDTTIGIPGIASGTLRAGVDSDGFYGGISGSLNIGSAKANIDIVADSKGNIRSYSAGATGPLFTNIKYSKEKGLSGGPFGLSVNKNKEVSFAHLEDALINKAGKQGRERYQSYRKETKKMKNETSDYWPYFNGPCKAVKR